MEYQIRSEAKHISSSIIKTVLDFPPLLSSTNGQSWGHNEFLKVFDLSELKYNILTILQLDFLNWSLGGYNS